MRLVVYVSTHDTDTAAGWFRSLTARERARTGLDPAEPHWGLIEQGTANAYVKQCLDGFAAGE